MAGLTLCLAIATATAVAKITIKQFFAIPLTGKVVAGPCMMAMPLFLYRDVESHSRTHGLREESPAGAIDTAMKTFHEWLTERMAKNEGLWLNDKNAVIGLSRLNPLPKNSAVKKSLAKGPAGRPALRCSPASPLVPNTGTRMRLMRRLWHRRRQTIQT